MDCFSDPSCIFPMMISISKATARHTCNQFSSDTIGNLFHFNRVFLLQKPERDDRIRVHKSLHNTLRLVMMVLLLVDSNAQILLLHALIEVNPLKQIAVVSFTLSSLSETVDLPH